MTTNNEILKAMASESVLDSQLIKLHDSRNYAELWRVMDDIAKKTSFSVNGENVMTGGCGFAWIDIYTHDKDDPRTGFISWLVGNNIASCRKRIGRKYAGQWNIWVGNPFNQSINHKETYADTIAKLLRVVGYERAYSGSRLD